MILIKLPRCPDVDNCEPVVTSSGGDRFICIGKLKTPIGPETHSICFFGDRSVRLLTNRRDFEVLQWLISRTV